MLLENLRELVCVFVKLMPNSRQILLEIKANEDAAGEANSHTECTMQTIDRYMSRTLGDVAPHITFTDAGWAVCVADLISKVVERHITPDQARACVYQDQVGSWNVRSEQLDSLGLTPALWTHPLILVDVRNVNADFQRFCRLQAQVGVRVPLNTTPQSLQETSDLLRQLMADATAANNRRLGRS